MSITNYATAHPQDDLAQGLHTMYGGRESHTIRHITALPYMLNQQNTTQGENKNMANNNIEIIDQENKNMANNNIEIIDQDMYAYFDDIDGHIIQLELEESLQDDSEYCDALHERIVYLKKQKKEYGIIWVDNDLTNSPDAWKSHGLFTDIEAKRKLIEWD
jgi:hypothetical protein